MFFCLEEVRTGVRASEREGEKEEERRRKKKRWELSSTDERWF
jgi:hypothetical protein